MDVFWLSIQSLLSIIIMIAIGYFCQAAGWLSDGFQSSLSKLIMNIALPPSIFMAMLARFHPRQLSNLWAGVLLVIISIFVGYGFSYLVTRVFKVAKGRRGLMMVAFNGANTVFIGMPLNIALFGDRSVAYLLVYYIVNTVIIWTFGVWVIAGDDPTSKLRQKTKIQ